MNTPAITTAVAAPGAFGAVTTTETMGGRSGAAATLVRRSPYDWLYAALLVAGAGFAFSRYGASMDGY